MRDGTQTIMKYSGEEGAHRKRWQNMKNRDCMSERRPNADNRPRYPHSNRDVCGPNEILRLKNAKREDNGTRPKNYVRQKCRILQGKLQSQSLEIVRRLVNNETQVTPLLLNQIERNLNGWKERPKALLNIHSTLRLGEN